MFEVDSTVASKYLVTGLCSTSGGMGSLVFVNYIGTTGPTFVLKYCKLNGEEVLARFKREVQVMQQFAGNPHVMPIVDANLDHNPPYFVMPHFEYGDLQSIADRTSLRRDVPALEQYFNRMIDCLKALHDRGIYHRDIKPQNFLVGSLALVISDFGLCTASESMTGVTRSSGLLWGTEGYYPPEFFTGGFKHADSPYDIYMLGKTFYVVLTGGSPNHLDPTNLPPQLYPVLERCCAPAKANRYQSLDQLRQSLKVAFDAVLGRASGVGQVYDTLRNLMLVINEHRAPDKSEVNIFIDQLAALDEQAKIQLCLGLQHPFFSLLQNDFIPPMHLGLFIAIYRVMAEKAEYAWSFAEDIALNMKLLFDSYSVTATNKSEALRTAIVAAHRQRRYAAMDTCTDMIISITESELAQRVYEIIVTLRFEFLGDIDQSKCKSSSIRNAIAWVKAANEAQWMQSAQTRWPNS